MTGTVFGLGLGPGDPELVTLKAWRLLQAVPVIAYPVQADGSSLARAIADPHLPGDRVEIRIHTPMGEPGAAEPGYRQAAAEMAPLLEGGQDIAVLCEGDPLFYGSFMYVAERMAGRFPIEVVAGVSSLSACTAVLGRGLVGRNEVLTVLPAPLADDRLRQGLSGADAVAIMKVGRHLPRLRRLLDEFGLTGQAHYVERAAQAGQRLLPLAAVEAESATYFSMILVRREGMVTA